MIRHFTLSLLLPLSVLLPVSADAQTFHFSFDGRDKQAVRLTASDTFNEATGYGFDFISYLPPSAENPATAPFFLSVSVPDGNYRVVVTLGSRKQAGNTTVRAESRRLFLENIPTKKGEYKTFSFIVNKRNTTIYAKDPTTGELVPTDRVRIKQREQSKLDWDDKLTLEINGTAPACSSISISPAADSVTTLWLCGNSTVVDQDYEPWASWGQMLPRWFDDGVAVANYAESGETASTFIAAGRLKKILSQAKPGDYVFVEFGHNDQKQKFAGAGAWYNFSTCLKQFVDEARQREAIPVFLTPTQRRSFDRAGKIQETHGDYPDAMRAVARREGVAVIELHDMTRTFYEAMGVQASTRAFVHYPAHTFPGQEKALADNTHFNPYGAYEISKMVVEGMLQLQLPVTQHLRPDHQPFNPARPDSVSSFHWIDSPFFEALKPDGN